MNTLRTLLYALVLSVSCGTMLHAQQPPKADPQMQAVLDQLAMLHPKPIENLTPAQARKQPTPTDAVKALLKKQGRSTAPEPVAKVEDTMISGAAGMIPARIYTPDGSGPFPVIVYFHGGGWVIANNDVYDATPRALVNAVGAIVVSVEYRKAPENRFPAAHDDAYAATQYVLKNAATMNGDPKRVAVAGESAGGNMASAVCLMARDRKGRMPVYQALIYPVTSTSTDYPSFQENANARPLNKAMMLWFVKYTLADKSDAQNPYLNLMEANVSNLPPATVITAQIDPLHDEGKAYSEKLKSAGVDVRYMSYEGVTHEFFGMAAVVDRAKEAQMFVADGLRAAFRKAGQSASTRQK